MPSMIHSFDKLNLILNKSVQNIQIKRKYTVVLADT